MNKCESILRLAVVIVLTAAASMAQQPITSITGTLTDQQGAVIPGVKVNLKGKASSVVRIATTDDEGSFTFLDLTPDKYVMSVTWSGVARTLTREVEVKGPERKTLNIIFPLAPCSDEPEATKNEPLTEEDRAAIVRELVSFVIGTVDAPDDKRPIFVRRNFKVSWLTEAQLSKIRIMTRPELQVLTDRTEDQWYWWLSELKQNGSCITAYSNNNLTMKGETEDANMAAAVKIYEFRKVNGKWVGLLFATEIS